MFNAPPTIIKIKEIKAIYETNEKQAQQLREDIKKLEVNLSIDTATEELIAEWEKSLKIQKSDLDNLEERRFRVKSRVFQKIPYTYRTLKRKLEELCGVGGYELQVNTDTQEVICYVSLDRKAKLKEVERLLEDIIPLNMTISLSLLYNRYKQVKKKTYQELSSMTYNQVRSEVFR